MTAEGIDYIKKYFSQYWYRIQEAQSFVPPEYLPEFMKSTRKLVIYDCTDGYLTLMYSDTGNITTSSYKTSRRVQDVFDSQGLYDSRGNRAPKGIKLGIRVSGNASVHIGEPKIKIGNTLFHPRWLVAHIMIKLEPSVGLLEDPIKRAEKDIRTLLLKRKLGIEETLAPDQAKEKVIPRLEELLNNFRSLLEDTTKEQELQDFIEANSILIAPYSQKEDVYPKYKLGKEHITDFIIENKPPTPFSHTCIEIEPASEPLFLRAKGYETQLTQRTNHAIEQLRDWRIWIRDNIAYLKNDFPSFDQCEYILIIGRGNSFTTMQRRKITELNAEHNWRSVYTYDDLADRLDQLIKNLREI